MNNAKTIIMLASYNGGLYIREQLDSILNNTYKNVAIIISDDGSTDNTIPIIQEYIDRYSCVTLIKNTGDKHGALHNFANLIRYVKEQNIEADYYMFSDQDDVWIENKICSSVKMMQQYDSKRATLVYSSKQYVDEKLYFLKFNTKGEDILDINILHQNKAFGCTFIFNKQLLQYLENDISEMFINYDHYVVIQAFLYGEIHFLPEKTILYRQHGNNVSGVMNKSFKERMKFTKKYYTNVNLYKFLIRYFYDKIDLLSSPNNMLINKLHSAYNSRIKLIVNSIQCKIKKNTLIGTIQFYFALLLFGNLNAKS